LIRASRNNAIAAWERLHFEEPMSAFHPKLDNVIICSHPPVIRHILVDNSANYPKDTLQRAILARGFDETLLTSTGEDWQSARRLTAGLFSPKSIADFAKIMRSHVERLIAKWEEQEGGYVASIAEEMTRFAFDVLNEAVFSNAIGEGARVFFEAITLYSDTQGGRKSDRAVQKAGEAIRAVISARRARLDSGDCVQDLLTLLLGARDGTARMPDRAVEANILLFFAAGHETVACALTWALYLLFAAPDICEIVRAEADAAAIASLPVSRWLEEMPMTRAVVEETLRLYPSVPLLSRTAIVPETVDGHRLPRGARIVVAPWILHRHRRLWRAPDQFLPERFLPGRRESIDRYSYLPFGAGPRMCIGARFALHEMVILISMVARSFTLTYVGLEDPMPEQRINLRLKGAMSMRVDAR
jgi:cytochrome P450